jgi:hypothetical protein
MRENEADNLGVVNASPVEIHRRQMARQVWLPIILTLVVVLALTILAIVGTVQGSSQVNRWGNISAVLVIIPVMVWGVVLLVIFGGLAYLVRKMVKKMPGWMLSLQLLLVKLSQIVRRFADAVTRPIFTVNLTKTRAAAFKNWLLGKKTLR